MRHSAIINFFYGILPFHTWKDALLRHHIEKCPACFKRLASREEVRRLLIQAGETGDLEGLWPAIFEKIQGIRPMPVPGMLKARATMLSGRLQSTRRHWRWVAALAGIFLAVFLALWSVRYFRPFRGQGGGGVPAPELGQVQINYVRIDNEPAQTFIFKPYDSHVVIVWAGKNL
jgi:anti-sigma factor RsiW